MCDYKTSIKPQISHYTIYQKIPRRGERKPDRSLVKKTLKNREMVGTNWQYKREIRFLLLKYVQ